MGLLAFEDPHLSPDSKIIEYSNRHKLASDINAAILESLCKSHGKNIYYKKKEKRLPTFIKMLKWSQMRAKELIKIPEIGNMRTGSY